MSTRYLGSQSTPLFSRVENLLRGIKHNENESEFFCVPHRNKVVQNNM
jgi:hypothetical protein